MLVLWWSADGLPIRSSHRPSTIPRTKARDSSVNASDWKVNVSACSANRDNSPTPHLCHTAVFTLHHSLSCQFNSHLHRHLNFDSELARLTMTILTRDCNIVGPQQPPPLDLDPHWQLICHSELAQLTRLTCAMLVDLLLSIFIHVHHGSATA